MGNLLKINKSPPFLAGDRFARLTVICETELRSGLARGRRYLCICDCGKYIVARGNCLKTNNTKSCGCLSSEHAYAVGKANKKHGLADKHPLWNVWIGMKARCYNKNNPRFDRYGGRGITICERWNSSFVEFANDMGERPSKKHSINRINNDGNYEPENCEWATAKEQCKNRGGIFSKTA